MLIPRSRNFRILMPPPEKHRQQRRWLMGLILGLVGLCCHDLFADVTVTEPTGGNNISADTSLNSTNGAGFTALGNIVIAEGFANDFATGTNKTFILTLPAGWQFNTAASATVSFLGTGDIKAASVGVTLTTVTVTLTVGGNTKFDQLTISGLQVQPLDGSMFNAGYILNLSSNPGTELITGVFQDSTTFGLVNTVPGTPKSLQILTQPSATANAGSIFAIQPRVDTFDQFGVQCYNDNSTVVTAARAAGTSTLQGATTQQVLGGDIFYSDLSFNVVSTITIAFTAPGLTSVTSTTIAVGPGIANHLAFITQPGSAASGFPFGTEPVVRSQDQFGNSSTVGLAATQIVTMTLSSGTGPLLGAANQDFGTNAGNGVATYTNLEIAPGGNKQLTASSRGFTNAVSSVFNVSGAAFSKLLVLS